MRERERIIERLTDWFASNILKRRLCQRLSDVAKIMSGLRLTRVKRQTEGSAVCGDTFQSMFLYIAMLFRLTVED